jgi:hypothetical protein
MIETHKDTANMARNKTADIVKKTSAKLKPARKTFSVSTPKKRLSASEKAALMFETDTKETIAEIEQRVGSRFAVMEELVNDAINDGLRSVFISGPPGLGKSYTVEEKLAEWDPSEQRHAITKGYVKTTGLYRLLYRFRHPGNIIVFDDADTIFSDEASLNMLKAASDFGKRRRISYAADYKMVDDETGEALPNSFDFEGTIIWITNYDFQSMIEKGHKLAPHFDALMDRAHYLDLLLKTRRDYLVRIAQVVRAGLLDEYGFSPLEKQEVMNFVEVNASKFQRLSLRAVMKVADIRKSGRKNWREHAEITCLKH